MIASRQFVSRFVIARSCDDDAAFASDLFEWILNVTRLRTVFDDARHDAAAEAAVQNKEPDPGLCLFEELCHLLHGKGRVRQSALAGVMHDQPVIFRAMPREEDPHHVSSVSA